MSTRLNPLLNLITDDKQYAYKQKRSTIDVLALINKVIRYDGAHQLILFDLSKAFDNIERDILWPKLCEAGLPLNFIRTIKVGHEGIKLTPKCGGYIGKSEDNNKGVFQGSPLSATLFIIYAEQMMKQYQENLPTHTKRNAHNENKESRQRTQVDATFAQNSQQREPTRTYTTTIQQQGNQRGAKMRRN